ncbi:hypothetical protein MGG_16516 [Pyricularia oryzae 70-15]|uniref:Uncharacterized protein n=1 Tax=Pyricularia oryzae (strain 70-15 / ATCC MYA-4617 / FGSC 8958) TaxID=242507 RepID=G4MRT9_PYRO7|nr:uncharacterized protein MGG_16516 [Pyricularia oryzae 70-15]EHA58304.1 hypothetical protein MGG_16516 [Pyricularia oryzae 70-15]KAI7927974.1 hypothetical protein M9X92_002038 [Pyricularia oryzae]KAI7928557.1 hypothetical protein M0657_002665 [Pyricularia oryzae]
MDWDSTADGRHPHICKRLVTFEATTFFFFHLLCNPPPWFIDPSIAGLSCKISEAADALLRTNKPNAQPKTGLHLCVMVSREIAINIRVSELSALQGHATLTGSGL